VTLLGLVQSGVDLVSWTPDVLGNRSPRCRNETDYMRLSSGSRWLNWCEQGAARSHWPRSSSLRHRQSAIGSSRPIAMRAGGPISSQPLSAKSCRAFDRRIDNSRSSPEILSKAAAQVSRGRPARSCLRIRVRESTPGPVSDRHAVPRAGRLHRRVLRVAQAPAVGAGTGRQETHSAYPDDWRALARGVRDAAPSHRTTQSGCVRRTRASRG
jgi:hypothetical protein